MITRLRAENFKSWKDTGDLRLGRLTGLFGTNSSGKTSILQVLPLLKQTASFPDNNRVLYLGNDDSPVFLGSFREIIHGKDLDSAVGLAFSWRSDIQFSARQRPYSYDLIAERLHAQEFSFRTSIRQHGEAPEVDFFRYELGGRAFGMERVEHNQYALVHRPTSDALEAGSTTKGYFPFGGEFTDATEIPFESPVKCYGFPADAGTVFDALRAEAKGNEGSANNHDALPPFQLAFEYAFQRVHYLGPLRVFPRRVYQWGGEKPLDTDWDGEQTVETLLAYRIVEKVAQWLKDMDLVDSFKLQPVGESGTIYQCYIKRSPTATEVLLPDVGFGVSQIVPVLANCAILPAGSTLLLEQPEIHLHPFAQAALADVLINAIESRNIQIIVESHSEHLLRRIQRRIAEGAFTAKDAALYFCHIEDDASQADELELDSYGYIKNWPKHFFGDEMEEVAKMTIAASERRKAGRP